MLNFELKRKFLMAKAPRNLGKYPAWCIYQNYIIKDYGENLTELRVRRDRKDCMLTFKNFKFRGRPELNIRIDLHEHDAILNNFCTKFEVKKWRRLATRSKFTAKLDYFDNELKGLILIEVEFRKEEELELFVPPAWFGREVTNDPRYYNGNLAISGIPDDYVVNEELMKHFPGKGYYVKQNKPR